VTDNVPSAPTNLPGPLSRGYAVFASDSGHEGANGSVDGAFSVNAEAYDNFMGEALKKTHDAALVIIDKRYGTHPYKAYFAGGSTGGREALTVAQRWPQDWDGVIAFYPAYDFTTLSLQQVRVTEGFAAPGAYLDTAQRALLLKAVMQACDGLDGAVDGLISVQCDVQSGDGLRRRQATALPRRCRARRHVPVGPADRGAKHDEHAPRVRVSARKRRNAVPWL
jgi:feruloyl esterase